MTPPVTVALTVATGPPGVLLIERRDRLPPVAFPGGKVEPGETVEHASVRETGEETATAFSRCASSAITSTRPRGAHRLRSADLKRRRVPPGKGVTAEWRPTIDGAACCGSTHHDLVEGQAMGRHSSPGTTIPLSVRPASAAESARSYLFYRRDETLFERHDPMVGCLDEAKGVDKAALKRIGLIGGAVLGSVIALASLTDAGGQRSEDTLSHTPEAAVLHDCEGASSSKISEARYVGTLSDGGEIWGVPWTDDGGRTYAAYVVEASPTAPKKYLGTYSATLCNWVTLRGSFAT